jgi:hypothetical protein
VLEVLKATFTQQGKGADWEKVEKKYKENEATRVKNPKVKKCLSAMDVQAALQSEAGWKGGYWAPDPTYTKIPKEELSKANFDEARASYTNTIARDKGIYYKDYATKGYPGYPGVSVDQRVTNYAPEAPNTVHGDASKTKKDTTRHDTTRQAQPQRCVTSTQRGRRERSAARYRGPRDCRSWSASACPRDA